MSDEWNWGQNPKKTDDTPRQSDSDVSAQAASDQQTAPEEDLNENVTYHYKYTRSREAGGNAADSDNGNYYASHNYGGNESGSSTRVLQVLHLVHRKCRRQLLPDSPPP